MATARRSASLAPHSGGGTSKAPDWPTFAVFGDNGGQFHWEIVAPSGESLARSGGYRSEKEASKAARRVCAGTGAVSLDQSAADAARAA